MQKKIWYDSMGVSKKTYKYPYIMNTNTQEIFDPLSAIESSIDSENQSIITLDSEHTQEVSDIFQIDTHKKESSLWNTFVNGFKFLITYLFTTWVVFWILIFSLNFSAYSSIISSYMNPNDAKASAEKLQWIMDSSRIQVFADAEYKEQEKTEKQESIETIKGNIEESTGELPEESIYDPEVLIRSSEEQMDVSFDITPYDNRIIIPKIGKNIPLVDVRLDQEFDFDHMENIFMKELEKWVVRYPGTALPGEQWNTFIFGHSSNYPWIKGEYNDVFALLDNLDFWDEIIIYYNQKKFIYTVQEKEVVRPGNVKVLEREQNRKELSLMTCWPVGTTLNRMIVFAALKETP